MDLERQHSPANQLLNTSVHTISWQGVTATVDDRKTKQKKAILDNVEGIVKAGELCALMGPSGSGKTTLLNVLARRPSTGTQIEGDILINGSPTSENQFRQIIGFVEVQETLIGALSVFETLWFTSRLANSKLTATDRLHQINTHLESLGLVGQSDTVIGTPVQQGISDGQKRRLTVARQLVTSPKILFLDEPTSGLDSAASYEPSASTFNVFDKLLLLSTGKPHYFGPVTDVVEYYAEIGVEIPHRVNPADFLLEMVNIDFSRDKEGAAKRLGELQSAWQSCARAKEVHDDILRRDAADEDLTMAIGSRPNLPSRTLTLLHRSFIKLYRDPMGLAIRFGFAVGFGILAGTAWLRLGHDQGSISALITEALFILCFLSISAAICAAPVLEDHAQLRVELRNGLYGVTEFLLSNFVISTLQSFFMSIIFSSICYWLSNLHSSPSAFFTWVMWIFLAALASEGLVVFIISIFANFIFTIAVACFLDSLLLCSLGFFIPTSELNAFYKYAIHYWDYLSYSFEGLVVSQFRDAVYECGPSCHCSYDSPLAKQCQIAGSAVLQQYGYEQPYEVGNKVGITIAIILGYRLASWILLRIKG